MAKCIDRAELSACDEAASFLQSGFWGAFKARFGWEALAFRPGNDAAPLLVLRRSLAAGFSLAYVPWGPELSGGDKYAALNEIALALRAALPKDTCFIRFDPPWHGGPDVFPPPLPAPFVRSGADIQSPDTVLVSLDQSMESVMEQMKPKWRYNVRLAVKKGVAVRRAGTEEIDLFYDLLKVTSRRDGIAIHGKDYYRTLFDNTWYKGKIPDIRLYLAEHEGELIAGIVTLFWRKQAVYLYGASSDRKRNLMAPYALQVKAMEDAKEAGCAVYDLFGISPRDDPSHPMAGLYRFKTGFGGSVVHRPGSWDYPCRPLVYRLFRAAETLRKNVRTIKKRVVRNKK